MTSCRWRPRRHRRCPVFLIGHSMGGMLAVAYAEEHQDRLAGVVVTGPAVVLGEMITGLLELDEIPAVPLGEFVSRDPGVATAYDEDPLNYHGRHAARGAAGGARRGSRRCGAASATSRVPILAMHGEQDALAPMQGSIDVIVGVSSGDRTLRIWPGLYHEIFNEPERDRVIGEVIRWITERPAGRGLTAPGIVRSMVSAEALWKDNLQRLGEFIKAQRQMNQLSQRELARLSDLSDTYMSQIERGLHEPSIRVLRALAESLGIQPSQLINYAAGFPVDGVDDRSASPHRGRHPRRCPPDHGAEEGAARRRQQLCRRQRAAVPGPDAPPGGRS